MNSNGEDFEATDESLRVFDEDDEDDDSSLDETGWAELFRAGLGKASWNS